MLAQDWMAMGQQMANYCGSVLMVDPHHRFVDCGAETVPAVEVLSTSRA